MKALSTSQTHTLEKLSLIKEIKNLQEQTNALRASLKEL